MRLVDNQILFAETQRVRQRWLWVILLSFNGLSLFVFFSGIGIHASGNQTVHNVVLLSGTIFILLPTVLTYKLRLETHITKEALYIKFFPFHLSFREFKWNRVSKAFIRKYAPLAEYGGWGVRFGRSGKAFNVSGNMGLQLEFIDNTRLLIGTNKPAELAETLNKLGQLKP